MATGRRKGFWNLLKLSMKGILLTWGFLFLNRFLEKMARRDR